MIRHQYEFFFCVRSPVGGVTQCRRFSQANVLYVPAQCYPWFMFTVEPLYNGPVLSGQFSKSRFFAHTNAVFVTCIRWPPLLSGRGHPVAVLSVCLSLLFCSHAIKSHGWPLHTGSTVFSFALNSKARQNESLKQG